MVIQWFPGHMTKAIRVMEKEIKLIDAVIYVLDARAPFSCVNPKFTKLIGNKPIIYVLNKADIAEDEKTKAWYDYFSKKGNACVIIDSTQSNSAKKIENALRVILQDRIKRLQDKQVTLTIRAMVLGVPNSGKSTLINNLSGKSKTATANRPGVTRGKQWVKLASGIEVLDTPGTLWPAFDNNHVALHLAYVGSIREQVLDIPDLSLHFINDVRAINPQLIKNRFNIEFNEETQAVEILEDIARVRGYKVSGGEIDYDRAAAAVLGDFKNARYGKLTLEEVSDINKLLENHRQQEDV